MGRDCLVQDLAREHILVFFPPSFLFPPTLLPVYSVNTQFLENSFLEYHFFSKSLVHESLYQGVLLRTRSKLVSGIYNKLACQ